MKHISLILLIMCGIIVVPVHAQSVFEFGYQQHPGKLLENTEGIIQIYVKSGEFMIPKDISDLQVTSSDRSVIQILGIEKMSEGYATNIKLKTNKSGVANISIAAPGFISKEIPVTVYTSNNNPTDLLIKATPKDFSIDGPKFGYVTVELVTSGSLPTKTDKDIIINLESPNSDIIKLNEKELVIEAGKYFAISTFEIKESGDAIIFARTEGMKAVSEQIHVREAAEPLTLKLYAYPQIYLAGTNNIGFAIIQLEDADGLPVKATEDIKIKIAVENPEASKNTSHDFEEIIFQDKQLLIKEGTYSTYTSFIPRPNFASLVDNYIQNDATAGNQVVKSFTIGMSAEDYRSKGSQIDVVHDTYVGALNGKGPVLVQPVPFLVSGEKEILGVAYLQADIEVSKQKPNGERYKETVTVPVMADETFNMYADSSDLKTVSIIDPEFKTGVNAAILFGDTGTVIPSKTEINFTFEDNEGIKTFTGLAEGPIKDDLSIISESTVEEVLSGEDFFILSYMNEQPKEDTNTVTTTDDEEEEDGRLGPTYFISDTVVTFSADDIIEIEPKTIKQNDPYALIKATAHKVGDTTITGAAGSFETALSIESKTTDPTQISLSHMKTIFPGSSSFATVQLLDSSGNPVNVKNDIEIKFVSEGLNAIKLPEKVTIPKGGYFKTFEIKGVKDAVVNISALSEDFPLAKFEVNVASIKPNLVLSTSDSVNPNEEFAGKMQISFDDLELPLSGYQIDWDVQGGEIKQKDIITNEQGIASIRVKAIDQDQITITANISGNGFFESSISKSISIIKPIMTDSTNIITNENNTSLPIDGGIIVLIIIPIVIGAIIFFLKKTNRLEDISERINIGDKIEEIKEKISDLKER